MTLSTSIKPYSKRLSRRLTGKDLEKDFKKYYLFRLTYIDIIYLSPFTSKTYLSRLNYLALLKRLFSKTPLELKTLKRR